jgi:hypothetical protein
MVSLIVYVMLDLIQPAGATIRVNQEPLERLLQSIGPWWSVAGLVLGLVQSFRS